jgi:hypothetical protein
VNEILPSGEVIHLDNLKAPKHKTDKDQRNGTQASATDSRTNNPQDHRKQDAPELKQEENTETLKEHFAPTKQAPLSPEAAEQKSSSVKPRTYAGESMGDLPSVQADQDVYGPIRDPNEIVIITTLPVPGFSVDQIQKVFPHKRIPPPFPSVPLSMQNLDEKNAEKVEKAEKTARKKETVLIRQTEQGWIEVDQEQEQKLKDQEVAQDATAGITSEKPIRPAPSKQDSKPEEVRYGAKPSTQAQWQAFAGTETASNKGTSFQVRRPIYPGELSLTAS